MVNFSFAFNMNSLPRMVFLPRKGHLKKDKGHFRTGYRRNKDTLADQQISPRVLFQSGGVPL